MDVLTHYPKSNIDVSSNVESEEYKAISCVVASNDLTDVVNQIKLPIDLKQEIKRGNIQKSWEMIRTEWINKW